MRQTARLPYRKEFQNLQMQKLVLQCEGTVYCYDLLTSLLSVLLRVAKTLQQSPYGGTDQPSVLRAVGLGLLSG